MFLFFTIHFIIIIFLFCFGEIFIPSQVWERDSVWTSVAGQSNTHVPQQLLLVEHGVSTHVDWDEQVRVGVQMDHLHVLHGKVSGRNGSINRSHHLHRELAEIKSHTDTTDREDPPVTLTWWWSSTIHTGSSLYSRLDGAALMVEQQRLGETLTSTN